MNKDKQAFRAAIHLLKEGELAPEQMEALATVERFPGKLRRQIAELKIQLEHVQHVVAAEWKLGDRQQVELIKSRLEEKLRASENRARLLESRVRILEAQSPNPFRPPKMHGG